MSTAQELAARARRLRGSGLARPSERSMAETSPGGGTECWLAVVQGWVSGALYDVAEVVDSSASPDDPLELTVKPNGLQVRATNITELGVPDEVGGDPLGFNGILRAPTGITPPSRYVIVHEIDAGAGTRYVFETYPGQVLRFYGFRVTGKDQAGCPCGDWYQLIGPSLQQKAPTMPGCT